MIKCVIFDIDGTLLDSESVTIRGLKRVAEEELGRTFSREELVFALGIPGNVTLEHLGVENIDGALEKWNEYMRQDAEGYKVFAGIREVLIALKEKGIRTGVVTSRTREEIDNDFVPFGLMDYMEYSVSADDTQKFKPNPDPLLKYLEVSGISPTNAVYIGDTIYDKQCANDAGVKFALALWGARNPDKIGGDYLLENPLDIIQLLQE